jgi:hypothetical protein
MPLGADEEAVSAAIGRPADGIIGKVNAADFVEEILAIVHSGD